MTASLPLAHVVEKSQRRIKSLEEQILQMAENTQSLEEQIRLMTENAIDERSNTPEPIEIPESCYNCDYFYGGEIVCAIHPRGKENCPDLRIEQSNRLERELNNSNQQTIRITHQQTIITSFNGVRTLMSLEDLNLACVYLQLIYAKLPVFSIVEDVLSEDNCVKLLSQFYGCEPILYNLSLFADYREVNTEDYPEIDLYWNWNDYAFSVNRLTLNDRFARPGVKLAMIDLMLREAIIAVELDSTSKRAKVVEQLRAIKNGEDVPIKWGLKTLDRSPYTGSIVNSSEPDLLEMSEKVRRSQKFL